MIDLTLKDIAEITQGHLIPGTDPALGCVGLSIDSRQVLRGGLFVALQGAHFDAHDFVPNALQAGAAAALIEKPRNGIPGILVPSTLDALQALAAYWRRQFHCPVIAITGSCGKTTVKEILAAILGETGPVLATQGNLNNHIGVPLTLARLGNEHRHAVIEMGMNHGGELTQLSAMAAPDIALINNAGAAHLAGLGSVAAVAAAKGEILSGLGPRGIAVLNGDDAFIDLWTTLAPGEVWRFSLGDRPARVRGQWRAAANGGQMDIRAPQGQFTVDIPLPGRHNGANVLAACTAALALDIPIPAIQRAVAQLRGVPGRLQWREGQQGTRILDDTYNANPSSLEAAVQVLAQQQGKRYLILGDMGELGPDAALYHQQAGQRIREQGIDGLLTLGPLAAAAAASFGSGAVACTDLDDLVQAAQAWLSSDSTLLIKGSRAAQMERVVNALMKEAR